MDDLVLISVREHPEWSDRMIGFFRRHWATEASGMVYEDYIRSSIGAKGPMPQWYALVKGERIVAGCGLISNDFISRMDLSPWLAALYVEEDCRGRGLAGVLLQAICDSMAERGIKTLYLLTDHTHFYERYGWEYLCDAMGEGEDTPSRMYRKRTE